MSILDYQNPNKLKVFFFIILFNFTVVFYNKKKKKFRSHLICLFIYLSQAKLYHVRLKSYTIYMYDKLYAVKAHIVNWIS